MTVVPPKSFLVDNLGEGKEKEGNEGRKVCGKVLFKVVERKKKKTYIKVLSRKQNKT